MENGLKIGQKDEVPELKGDYELLQTNLFVSFQE